MTLCRVCNSDKSTDEFYPRQIRKDGAVGECKDCTKARVRARARQNETVRAYDRARASLPKRRENSAKVSQRWRENKPEGYRAHYAVSNAIRDGKLSKEPCLFCGEKQVHAHHKDYSKPLEVVWLCPKCHHRLHKTFPETEARGAV
jgi:ribosomal protein S27AE